MIRLESRVIRDDVKPRGLHLMPAIGVFAMFQLRSAAAFLLRIVIGNKKPCRKRKIVNAGAVCNRLRQKCEFSSIGTF